MMTVASAGKQCSHILCDHPFQIKYYIYSMVQSLYNLQIPGPYKRCYVHIWKILCT